MNKDKPILVVDDDRAVCKSLELLLRKNGYRVATVHHPSEVKEKIADVAPSLVMLDMNFTINTTGKQGLLLLNQIKEFYASLPVILMTGWGTLQLAVEGMKNGADDFLTKPWDNKHLLNSINTAIALSENQQTNYTNSEFVRDSIVGQSPEINAVLDTVAKVSRTNASVLITGESGTGKEVIAEAIHNYSRRANNQFVKVNLGGISASLFESEMFGHKKGAFTDAGSDREGRFAVADGGTIFLDEIGDLPLENQVKLLRVLQEKTFEVLGSSMSKKTDVRVICATHKPLQEMIQAGSFREDLYYRINLIEIRIPALRERTDDIPLLVEYFLSHTAKIYEFDKPYINEEAIQWLKSQDYPGNIRQLRNLIERTSLLSIGKTELGIKEFQQHMIASKYLKKKIQSPEIGQVTLEEMEEHMIRKSYTYFNKSVSQTARSLGITRSSLYRRLEKYSIN